MKMIGESSAISIGLAIVVISSAFFVGSYFSTVTAQGSAITDLERRIDQRDRDTHEFMEKYSDDMGAVRIDLATIKALLLKQANKP